MLIFTLLAARSTSTAETPAWLSFSLTNFLRRRSSCSHFEKSFSEYHLELQPRMTPRRKPTGCVFCPIKLDLFLQSLSRAVGEGLGEGSYIHLVSGTSTTTVTCDVRPVSRLARPIERAIQRRCTGPPSMNTWVTNNFSASAFSFSVAFAIAESSTLLSMRAALRCCMRRIEIASSTDRPLIMSATARTLRGDSRNRLKTARAMGLLFTSSRRRPREPLPEPLRHHHHRRRPRMPCAHPSDRGMSAWARTRPACDRP